MSCHARTADLLEDRDEHEDADLKKKTRGGKRMIGLHARLNSDARVFGLECHLAQLESEIRHFHGFDTAVFLQFPSENDALRSDFLLDYSGVRSICGCPRPRSLCTAS